MSDMRDLFAKRIKDDREKVQNIQNDLEDKKNNPVASIFLQRNKISSINTGNLHAKVGSGATQSAYDELFSTKNPSASLVSTSNLPIDQGLISKTSASILYGSTEKAQMAKQLSFLDRIRKSDDEKIEKALRKQADPLTRTSDNKKQTLLLNSRQLGAAGTFNSERDTSIMRQDIEKEKERQHERVKQEYLAKQRAAQALDEENRKKKQKEFHRQQYKEEKKREAEEEQKVQKAIEAVVRS